ncbi:RNA polymerase sigma factor [Thermodesulfobacteriota bacterium]
MKYSTDRELIAGCVKHDRVALEELIKKFSDPVYRSIQYTCKVRNVRHSIQDVEDLHNSVFVNLFEKKCKRLSQFKGKNGCSLHTWIRIITVRMVIDYFRKQGRDAINHRYENPEMEILDNIREENPGVLEEIDRKEKADFIRKGMAKLKPRDNLFLKLHCQDGLNIREVSELMNITEENAYSIKHRAIKRLKEVIQGSGRSGSQRSASQKSENRT